MALEGPAGSRLRPRSNAGRRGDTVPSNDADPVSRRRLGARRRRPRGEADTQQASPPGDLRSQRRSGLTRAGPPARAGTHDWRHALLWGFAGLVLVIAAWQGFKLWSSARSASPALPTEAQAAAVPAAVVASALPSVASAAPASSALNRLSVEAILARDSRALQHSGDGRDASGWPLVRLQSNPAVLVLEFPNLHEQGLALNRAAAFIEKKHSAGGQVLGDAEMQRLLARSGDSVATFYFGHDYNAEQLQRFFDRVQTQGLTLNPQERRLQALLQAHGLLKDSNGVAGRSGQALVSFTAIQDDDPATPSDEQVDALRRESTLRHELSHGEFFTDARYRRQCWTFWQHGLSEAERARFRQLLSSMDYDPSNEELMVNETQALLMHTPDPRAFNAGSLGLSSAQLEVLRDRFRQQQQQ